MREFVGHSGSWDLLRSVGPSAQWVQLCVSQQTFQEYLKSIFDGCACFVFLFVYVMYRVISESYSSVGFGWVV